uniref:muscarinic acetylcholine receptor M1-like n=1 Tax=Paramacrobiotus metropolitanus TaxID=2943436 RepID=UPI002445D5D7|nr:muscarinic acetylcholine receptor M1-like [Paramacrobiotus metropolitanus]
MPVQLNTSSTISHVISNSSTNTGHQPSVELWPIISPIAALLANSGVIILIMGKDKLQTTFNMYIVALALSNIAYAIIYGTLSIMNWGFTGQSWTLGVAACTARIYRDYALGAVTVHLHLLVSLTRAWALFGPMSYRSHHTIRLAVAFCIGAVVYVHIPLLPGIILDAMYYRLPAKYGCWINTAPQPVWATFTTVVIFVLPKLLIPTCYPVLLWKTVQRRRIAAVLRGRGNDSPPQSSTPSNARVEKEGNASRPFIVLTLFTIGVLVCWIPSLIFYILAYFIPPTEMPTFSEVVGVLYSLQAILDPIFFCLSVRDLWSGLCLMWSRCIRSHSEEPARMPKPPT